MVVVLGRGLRVVRLPAPVTIGLKRGVACHLRSIADISTPAQCVSWWYNLGLKATAAAGAEVYVRASRVKTCR